MPKTLATATVDRLLHHAHVTVTQGDSFRFTEATTGQGSEALQLIHTDQGRGDIWPPPGKFHWPPAGRTTGRLWGELQGR